MQKLQAVRTPQDRTSSQHVLQCSARLCTALNRKASTAQSWRHGSITTVWSCPFSTQLTHLTCFQVCGLYLYHWRRDSSTVWR